MFLNKTLTCFSFLFFLSGQLATQETKLKREGPVYRSIFLNPENEDLRVEITSAVFARESSKADTPKTYVYSCFIKNGGKVRVKLELLGFQRRQGSPVVSKFELKAGESIFATVESTAEPKIVPVSQIVSVSDGEGKWTTEGMNLSFVYVPDMSPPSPSSKDDSSIPKNTA